MENPASIQVIEDLHQSSKYGKYMERIGWRTIQVTMPKPQIPSQLFVRKLGPVAIAKMQRPSELPDTEVLNNILKENKVFMCKVEPREDADFKDQFKKYFKQDNSPLLGTKTLRVDLKPSEERIMGGFKKDCRYVLRKIRSTNLEIRSNNFELFYKIWRESAKRKSLWIPSKKDYLALVECFGKKCFCVTIGNDAGALILTHKKTAFYYYAGATKNGTENDLPYLVVWEGMIEAKKRGCEVWDFEGIYDSRWPNKGWKGFSHFKKSFGGTEVEFPGCFVKWRLPI